MTLGTAWHLCASVSSSPPPCAPLMKWTTEDPLEKPSTLGPTHSIRHTHHPGPTRWNSELQMIKGHVSASCHSSGRHRA